MKLEDIIAEWDKDGTVDQINVSNESANIPKLHNKYFKIYMGEGYLLRKMKTEYKKFFKLKTEYYRGELDVSELKQFGWVPQPLKILRQDIPSYMDADDDLIEQSLKVGAQEQKVEYLEAIIKMIGNRGFQLKTIVDWERFRTGA
jgi:hypothetical protein|tara:strand:- start:2563 stop:2997 length:435 start_codon:yes stop_codon:yes gene_type:complete